MTVLAITDAYLVEFESGQLTIARYSDGHCLAIEGKGIAGQFRACLRTHEPARVVETFISIANRIKGPSGKPGEWQPLYKPERMPRAA
jgi:hypothetical protein